MLDLDIEMLKYQNSGLILLRLFNF